MRLYHQLHPKDPILEDGADQAASKRSSPYAAIENVVVDEAPLKSSEADHGGETRRAFIRITTAALEEQGAQQFAGDLAGNNTTKYD